MVLVPQTAAAIPEGCRLPAIFPRFSFLYSVYIYVDEVVFFSLARYFQVSATFPAGML